MAAAVVGFLVVQSALAFIALGAVFGAGQEAFFVLANPYLSEHSRPEHRNELFALQAAIGNVTTVGAALAGGLLAAVVAALAGFDPAGPAAYRVVIAAMVVLLVASIGVAWRLGDDRPRRRLPADPGSTFPGRSTEPTVPQVAEEGSGVSSSGAAVGRADCRRRWFSVSNPGLFTRLLVPDFLISVGAGQCLPFINLFIQRKFGLDLATLNGAFAIAALGTAAATLLQPALARRFGQMGSVVVVQAASIPFLVVLGWVPILPLVLVALAVRNALMNAGNPILSAFAMERAHPAERATLSAAMSLAWSAGWVVGGPYYSLVQASLGFDLGYALNFVTVIVCYSIATGLYWWWFVRPAGGNPAAAQGGSATGSARPTGRARPTGSAEPTGSAGPTGRAGP